MSKTLTFAFDVEIGENEDCIKEGTQVQVYDSEYHINKYEGYVPVIIDSCLTFGGNKKEIPANVTWFTKGSFVELQ